MSSVTTRASHGRIRGAEAECPQCHGPKSECRPHVKHPFPMRARLDTRRGAEKAADDGQARDITSFVTEAMEARLGYLRCDRGRCLEHGEPIPLVFGDLTGMTLGEAITEAVREVARQHPRHEPVRIGAEPGTPTSPLSSGTAMFREPGQ